MNSFLRDTFRTSVQYFVAGLCFVLAGSAYVALRSSAAPPDWLRLPLFVGTLGVALLVWHGVGKTLKGRRPTLRSTPSASDPRAALQTFGADSTATEIAMLRVYRTAEYFRRSHEISVIETDLLGKHRVLLGTSHEEAPSPRRTETAAELRLALTR